MIKSLRFLLYIIPLLFFSCEKKILEIVPVTQKVEDLSIQNGGNIKLFSFPSSQVGYAASDTNFIYKTTDGGKSWTQVQFNNSQINSYAKCKKLEFYDDQNGICYLEDSYFLKAVLVTNNGGTTWTRTESNNLAGITTDGKAYICETSPINLKCLIKESKDKGKTFKDLISLEFTEKFEAGKVIGSTIFILDEQGVVHGYNPVNSDTLRYFIGITSTHIPMNDFLFTDWIKVAVGGGINGTYSEYGHSLIMDYDGGNGYYSVDAYQDFAIAVGKYSIVTNMETQDGEKWHEVFDQNGNGFNKIFYKIKFIDNRHFLVSGEKGLIWKMKI
jgi:hypothetical protein